MVEQYKEWERLEVRNSVAEQATTTRCAIMTRAHRVIILYATVDCNFLSLSFFILLQYFDLWKLQQKKNFRNAGQKKKKPDTRAPISSVEQYCTPRNTRIASGSAKKIERYNVRVDLRVSFPLRFRLDSAIANLVRK